MAIRYLSGVNIDSNTLVVDSTNNRVGINTASPDYALDLGTSGTGNQIRARRIYANGTGTDSGYTLDSTLIFQGASNSFNITNPGSYPSVAFTINSSGNVGIGTTSPTRLLEISATNPQFSIKSTSATGFSELYFGDNTADNGWIGYAHNGDYMYFGTNGSEKMRINSGGDVAINTTDNASAKLRVIGNGAAGNSAIMADYGNTSVLGEVSMISYRNSAWHTLYVKETGSSATNAVLVEGTKPVIFNAGDVGIGTTSPASKLDVYGIISLNGYNVLQEFGSNNVYANVRVIRNTSSVYGDGMYVNYNSVGTTSAHLRFFANGTSERMRIDASTGNVGIGTTSPVTKLHVVEDSNSSTTYPLILNNRNNQAGDGWGAGLKFSTSTPEGGGNEANKWSSIEAFDVNNFGSSSGLSFTVSETYTKTKAMVITRTGAVGIGTTSPSQKLHVVGVGRFDNIGAQLVLGTSGVAGAYEFSTTTGNALVISLSGVNERMRIDSSGNVGIGTTNIYENLTVSNSSGASIGVGTGGAAGTGASPLYTYFNFRGYGDYIKGQISSYDVSSNFVGGVLIFSVQNTSAVLTERMRISSAGALKLNAYGSGSNTGTATQRLAVDASGNVIEIPIGSGPVDGNGTANYVTKWSDADTITNSQIFDNGTNVGIGTTSPISKLQVNGQSRQLYSRAFIANPLDTDGYAGHIIVNSNNANGDLAGIGLYTNSSYSAAVGLFALQESSTAASMVFYTGSNLGAEKMRITAAGNVGIGTTSPATKLHVVGDTILQSTSTGNGTTAIRVNNSAGTQVLAIGAAGGIIMNNSSKISTTVDPTSVEPQLELYNGGTGYTTLQSSTSYGLLLNPSGGNVGIGTTSPQRLLSVGGAYGGTSNTESVGLFQSTGNTYITVGTGASSQGGLLFADSGSNNAGAITYSHNTDSMEFGTAGAERMRITSAGNVGIGTTSPAKKVTIAADSSTWAGAPQVAFYDTVSGQTDSRNWTVGAISTNYGNFTIANSTAAGGDPTTPRLTINKDGNVGIGTTSPAQKLDVNGAIAVSGTTFVDSTRRNIYLDSFSAGGGAGIFFRDGFTYNASITAEDHSGSAADGICISGGDGISFSTGSNSKNERMRITGAGNVGIGTTSPAVSLQVNASTAAIRLEETSASAKRLEFSIDSSAVAKISANQSAQSIAFETVGSERMRITDAGNVGIGTTSPSSKLHVSGDSYVTGQFAQGVAVASKITGYGAEFRSSNASAQIFFGRSGDSIGSGGIGADETSTFIVWSIPSFVKLLVVNQNGNVGIGTDAPSQKLHVVGNARVTGAYYDSNNEAGTSGQVLTSTGSGTDWKSLSEITGVDGTGTANYVAKWSDTDTITNSSITDNGTTVTATVDRLNMNKQAGIYVFSKTVSASASSAFFSISNAHGAQAFRVTFVCSSNSYSVAKTYEVVHIYGTTPVYSKVLDSGPYGSEDFDVAFTNSNSDTGCTATVTNSSTTTAGNIVATVFLGGGAETITVTAL